LVAGDEPVDLRGAKRCWTGRTGPDTLGSSGASGRSVLSWVGPGEGFESCPVSSGRPDPDRLGERPGRLDASPTTFREATIPCPVRVS